MSAGILALTGYYTGTEHRPVKDVGKTSLTGAATVILSGLSVGFESAVYTTLVIGAAVFGAYLLGGAALTVSLFAVALAGCGLLTTVGVIVAMDTFGPVSDNAQGIAEMSGDVSPEGAQILTELDAVGNTTKAITKGIAIATAVLAATALFGSYATSVFESLATPTRRPTRPYLLDFAVFNPAVLVGVLLGAAVVFLFSGLAINAVARAAGAVVYEVRRQFREIPGIMEGTGRPEYGKVVDIVTKDSLRELVTPGILAVLAPIAVGFGLGVTALAGFLAGAIGTGTLMAVFLANSGGAWDNAKKLVEDGNHGGKGSDAHAATVIGDTVGDPFKDTAGPAINPLIKVMNLVSLLIASAVVSMSVGDDQNDALRIAIALVAVAIIAVAVIISKRREVSIGDDQPVQNHSHRLTGSRNREAASVGDHGRRFVVLCTPRLSPSSRQGSPGPSGVAVRTCPGRAPPCTPPERRFNPPAGRVGAAGPRVTGPAPLRPERLFDRATPMARTGHGRRRVGRRRPAGCEDHRMSRPLDRIALISDVHGNLTALEAVLADIDARGIGRIFNLGDYVGKGPRGREVVDLCRERCEVNLLGNWDDFLPDPDRTFDSASLQWWLASSVPARGSGCGRCRSATTSWSAAGGSGCSTPPRRPCTAGSASTTTRRSSGRCSRTPRRPATARPRTWSGTPTPTTPTTRPTTTGGPCSTPAASATACTTRRRST